MGRFLKILVFVLIWGTFITPKAYNVPSQEKTCCSANHNSKEHYQQEKNTCCGDECKDCSLIQCSYSLIFIAKIEEFSHIPLLYRESKNFSLPLTTLLQRDFAIWHPPKI